MLVRPIRMKPAGAGGQRRRIRGGGRRILQHDRAGGRHLARDVEQVLDRNRNAGEG